MVWPTREIVLVITLVSLFLYPAVTRADVPNSYITEVVDVSYSTEGSIQQPVTRLGYVEVEIPNTQDVMQYLILNLSGTTGTNLQSITSYKGVAASPTPGSRTRMYLNTTASMSNISYEITNPGIAPYIYMGMDYRNAAGGEDLHSAGTNTLVFNVTLNASASLGSVTMNIRFARNTLISTDSISVYGEGSSSGSVLRQDTDSDGYYDSITWVGNLGTSDVDIWFYGVTTPWINFDGSMMSLDLDQGVTSQAVYQDNSNTFTGITFSDRFSRGPVREGVTIMTIENWAVRGFMTNMASGLDYRINSWELYQVGSGSPLISSSSGVYPFLPGSTEYTGWYDTGVSGTQDKVGYYSVAWDWEVDWGSSQYSSTSQATMELPVLYEIDAWETKSVVLESNAESGVSLSVQDLARHAGHSALDVEEFMIYSVLPRSSSGGASNTWSPSGIRVLFINGSGQIDITSQATISSQAAGASDGFVNVSLSGISSVLGGGLRQNEDIRLEYSVSGSSHTSTQTYSFCQTSRLVTSSGTPVTDSVCEDVVIPGVGGVVEPPPGGGGGGGGQVIQPALFADIVRDVGEGYFVADNLMSVTGEYAIVDTGDKGVKDIRLFIYIPEYGVLDRSSLSLRIYDRSSGEWEEWEQGDDYRVDDNGMTTFDGNQYREFMLSKISASGVYADGLQLFNNDRLELSYLTTVPVGQSFIVTRVSGYNYYEDSYIFEDLYIPARRDGRLQEPMVTEGEWLTEKVYVGRPVKWLKSIMVSNPNNSSVEYSMSLEVFPDSLSANILYPEEEKANLELKESGYTYVDVLLTLEPGETKTYVIEVTTPPVLETSRVVDIIESSETEIKFMANITMESFALEDYPGVSLLFRTDPERILYIREGEILLNHTAFDDDTAEIFLGDFGSGWKRDLTIVYSQIPPILVTSMDSTVHGCEESASMSIFLVPSERESDSYIEVEVIGPGNNLKTVSAQLIEMRELWPWEEVEIPITIDISSLPDGRYFVYSSFKKNFGTILSYQTDFTVNCPERMIISVSWVGFLGVAVAIIIYLIIRTIRRRHGEMRELRKRIAGLRKV